MNKTLIGVVTANVKDYCWYDFKRQLKWLESKGMDIYIVDNSRTLVNRGFKGEWIKPSRTPQETTLECMNALRDYFLKGDYDNLFILESDVFINDEALERLFKMQEMNGDVCNLTYPMRLKRFNKYSLCVQSTLGGVSKMITPEDSQVLINNGVQQLGKDNLCGRLLTHTGYGCTLVKRKVIEKIKFRATKSGDKMPFPDSFFHSDVLLAGFVNLLDTDYICEHRNLKLETQTAINEMRYSKLSRRERRILKGK